MRTLRRGFGRHGRPFVDVPSERRTRRDLVVTAIITAVLLVATAVFLLGGPVAEADFESTEEQPVYGPSAVEPTALGGLWAHPSADTGAPLVTKGNLVTVDEDGTLIGRDAGTGEQRWSYTHPGGLCAATFYSDSLVAAFHGAAGCSDVTALDTQHQHYASTRQSSFSDTMEFRTVWNHVLAFSPQRLEIWRDDLVRTVEYGTTETPQESGMQPRSECDLTSADLGGQRFAVSERCPDEPTVRLTVSKITPSDSRKPEEIASDQTGADELWIISVSDESVLALQRRGATWTVENFSSPTKHETVLELPGTPALRPSRDTLSGDNTQVRWFDGAATHAFAVPTGEYSWSARDTRGPGFTGGFAPGPEVKASYEWILAPTEDGFSVLDHRTGREKRGLEVRGTRSADLVGVSQLGDILYERRGDMVNAYKMSGG